MELSCILLANSRIQTSSNVIQTGLIISYPTAYFQSTAKLVCGQPGAFAVQPVVVEPEPKPGKSFNNQRMEELLVRLWKKQQSAILQVVVTSSFFLITIRLKHFLFQCVSQQNGQCGVSAQNPVGEASRFEPEKLTSLAAAHAANMRL